MDPDIKKSHNSIIQPDLENAFKLFNETFFRWSNQWSVVTNFRTTALTGLPFAKQKVELDFLKFIRAEMPNLLLGDKEKIEKFISDNCYSFAAKMTERTLANGTIAIDAASIVFAHTIIDTAAHDYLRIAALCSPSIWMTNVKDRKVSVSDILGATSVENLVRCELEIVLKQWGFKSLKNKLDRLMQITMPHKANSINGYEFDLSRLERIDESRIAIVHGDGLNRKVEGVESELWFGQQTCWYMLTKVSHKWDLKIDGNQWIGLPPTPGATG